MEFVIKTFLHGSECDLAKRLRIGLWFVCLWIYVWTFIAKRESGRAGDTQIGQIFAVENHHILSRSEFIKRVLHRRTWATYYVFIKRKHIQTLIFKWIFKRTYNHIYFQCAPVYFRLATVICFTLHLDTRFSCLNDEQMRARVSSREM